MNTRSTSAFIDRPFLVLLVLACVSVLAGLFVDMHAHFPWENVPGFFGVFAFVVCGAMCLAAGFVLRPLVKRPADYYDTDRS
ncbi:hypothetical protein [Megalodesulfovibrio gigas]|uniref:Uncharacterized protein n=1 Tax=Megalodesulfovibrio gigas (strain ATCC 19364 / DSM 1382 / NCIMB 9332 / VKM B-1759) TaxID=1121448 RepID=T2GEK7_MEGG1|nr:hypothetical protein [Megalodesulfovibrio gigas]AGW14579.1 hypothetical protein DGI_2851 [Megalodesulfovibrio gigas DSM 1382 = ATCC 19364]